MTYRVSKLAKEIANELDVKEVCRVWDILEELGYEPQKLDSKQVAQWTHKVSNKMFYQ